MAAKDLVISQRSKDKRKSHYDFTMSLPRSLHEAYKLYLSNTNHPAINMFSCSLKAHRSCNEAIIFLYGVSGAGKSTTLNHLFNAELIPTSAKESATDSVIEWVSSMHSMHWRVSNLEVGFIDVPGWGDSEGRDATNFGLMQQFLSVHPILGCKARKFYPNIVLIVFNSNDNRMLGSNSSAMKMLQTLSKLDIVDKRRPNVVIVLTHVCSHSPSEFSEKLIDQSDTYQRIARLTLGVNPPVVWMENNPSYHLEKQGDWTLLYDGTAQPLNLYEAMRDLMVSAGDELGKEATRLFFDNRSSNPPKERLIVSAKLCDKKILSKREREWIETMERDLPTYRSTPLNSCLLKFIDSHPNISMRPNEINGLLVALASCFPDKSDIHTKTIDYIESKVQPYLMSVQDKQVLTEALNLEVPELPECILAVGRGYDMSKGAIADGQIVEISLLDSFCSFLNRPLSNAFSILPFEGNRITFDSFDVHNQNKFKELIQVKLCLTSLPRDYENDTSDLIIAQIDRLISCSKDKMKRYFWIESGIFTVLLNFPYVTLSKGFCDSIESLPDNPFNESGSLNSQYTDFINLYGHSIIIKANGGGILEGGINMTSHPENELVDKVPPCLETIFDLIRDGISWREIREQLPEDQVTILSELDSTCIQWLGGDQEFTSKTVKDISHDMYLKWLKSLKKASVLFDYSFNLIPIHMLVADKYPIISGCLNKAMKLQLSDAEDKLFDVNKPHNLEAMGSKMTKVVISCSTIVKPSVNPVPKALSRLRSRIDDAKDDAKDDLKDTKQNRCSGTVAHIPRLRSRSLQADADKSDISKIIISCFSSDSKVALKNGECIDISEVSIGDSILSLDSKTNLPVYSQVYMWAHRDQETDASFVEIHHEQGRLKLSENHLLLLGHERRLTTASRVQIGDCVHFFQPVDIAATSYCLIASQVTLVCRCVQKGVYCPFTENSRIVVDGLVCSVFAVPDSSVDQFGRFDKMSQFAMSPFILANRIGCRDRMDLSCKMHPYLQMLLECYSFLPKMRECITK